MVPPPLATPFAAAPYRLVCVLYVSLNPPKVSVVFDVLCDESYRPEWDESAIESRSLFALTKNSTLVSLPTLRWA